MGVRVVPQRGPRRATRGGAHGVAPRVNRPLALEGLGLAATARRHVEAGAHRSAAEAWGQARDRFVGAGDLHAARDAMLGRVRALMGVMRGERAAQRGRIEAERAGRLARCDAAHPLRTLLPSIATPVLPVGAKWGEIALRELLDFVPGVARDLGPDMHSHHLAALQVWRAEHEQMANTLKIQLGQLPLPPVS